MKNFVVGIVLSLIEHIVYIALLTFIAMFVWNVGFAETFNFRPLTFISSVAIMTGIYFVNMVVNYYVIKFIRIKTLDKMDLLMKELGKK